MNQSKLFIMLLIAVSVLAITSQANASPSVLDASTSMTTFITTITTSSTGLTTIQGWTTSTVSATIAVSSYTTTSVISQLTSVVATVTNPTFTTSTVTTPIVSVMATVSQIVTTTTGGFFDTSGYSILLIVLGIFIPVVVFLVVWTFARPKLPPQYFLPVRTVPSRLAQLPMPASQGAWFYNPNLGRYVWVPNYQPQPTG